MSRKLRFFKDQIHKAGLMSAPRPILQPEMELKQLEAGGFLVSSKSHVVSEEIELDDLVYSNEDYADTTGTLDTSNPMPLRLPLLHEAL
ncbi:hypothetical protein RHGRI_014449 [Rhododendron griersonianum]|uniref:Uncharacterized protein n=1 Tax=Rhododendron griersonianum TaxID=479676 RepID=A0AAV6K9C4_9ERIC|nr:hypothetical protein RHGRI_014449 [Rhododendron griersonianum]KAG5549081.1 hypothetical protein RHGRI_014449 [Rhododendron griersonianum]